MQQAGNIVVVPIFRLSLWKNNSIGVKTELVKRQGQVASKEKGVMFFQALDIKRS